MTPQKKQFDIYVPKYSCFLKDENKLKKDKIIKYPAVGFSTMYILDIIEPELRIINLKHNEK